MERTSKFLITTLFIAIFAPALILGDVPSCQSSTETVGLIRKLLSKKSSAVQKYENARASNSLTDAQLALIDILRSEADLEFLQKRALSFVKRNIKRENRGTVRNIPAKIIDLALATAWAVGPFLAQLLVDKGLQVIRGRTINELFKIVRSRKTVLPIPKDDFFQQTLRHLEESFYRGEDNQKSRTILKTLMSALLVYASVQNKLHTVNDKLDDPDTGSVYKMTDYWRDIQERTKTNFKGKNIVVIADRAALKGWGIQQLATNGDPTGILRASNDFKRLSDESKSFTSYSVNDRNELQSALEKTGEADVVFLFLHGFADHAFLNDDNVLEATNSFPKGVLKPGALFVYNSCLVGNQCGTDQGQQVERWVRHSSRLHDAENPGLTVASLRVISFQATDDTKPFRAPPHNRHSDKPLERTLAIGVGVPMFRHLFGLNVVPLRWSETGFRIHSPDTNEVRVEIVSPSPE